MDETEEHMKRSARILAAFCAAILTAICCLTGCRSVEEEAQATAAAEPAATALSTPSLSLEETLKEEIEAVMQVKLDALTDEDYEKYLSTVTAEDEYYYNEQARWYSEMIKPVISSVSFEVESVRQVDEASLEATIRQRHTGNGEAFDFTYPLLFRMENGDWKDCGYNFESVEKPRYTLKYMPGETRVEVFTEMIDAAYESLATVFEEQADDHFEIKLFWDREMLRQRTIPSIAWQFTGWGEPNESLKLYTGHEDIEGYRGTIQHELVHHITIKICNNNLADWLLEGTAIYYGNAYYDYSLTNALSNIVKENLQQTIEQLEGADLYNPSNQQEVWDWYNASFGYVAYLVETYGKDTFMQLYYEAGKKPFNNSVTNENFKANNIETTRAALETVLGVTAEQLSQGYLAWLGTTGFFDVKT